MHAKAQEFVAESETNTSAYQREPLPPDPRQNSKEKEEDESSDDDMPGPALPGHETVHTARGTRSGPAIPNSQDLELQRGKLPIYSYSFTNY